MLMDIDEIFSKFEPNVIKNIEKDNFIKIIDFLNSQNVDYIEDIITDYLDLFLIDYDEFVLKFNELNKKYNNNLVENIANDSSILEEFYD